MVGRCAEEFLLFAVMKSTMPHTHISLTCDQCCIILSVGSIMELKCPPSLEEKNILIIGYIH